jgi:drug/metabolite transporter (DMT)-like permease
MMVHSNIKRVFIIFFVTISFFMSISKIDAYQRSKFKSTIQKSIFYKSSLPFVDALSTSTNRKSQLRLHFKKDRNDIEPIPSSLAPTSATTTSTIDQEKNNAQWMARTILLTVSAFYGTNFGCVKILGAALHPGVAAAFRFSLASLIFMPQMIRVFKSNRALVLCGLEVGLYNAIGYFAQAQSLLSTNASNVAFICSLAVVVVPIIESLFGEKKGWKYLSSALFPALLAAAGVGCLELGGATTPGIGDLWAFLQPLFFGLGFWRIESHMKNCKGPGETQAYTGAMMTMVFLLSSIWSFHDFILPVSHYGHDIMHAALTSQLTNIFQDWRIPAALLWTGIVTTALTSYGENIAMKDLDAAESTVIYSTEPLWGAAFASLTLGEHIGWNTVLGAVLILTACAWRSMSKQIMTMISSSTFLNADGMGEIIENINENVIKLTQQGITDIPEL